MLANGSEYLSSQTAALVRKSMVAKRFSRLYFFDDYSEFWPRVVEHMSEPEWFKTAHYENLTVNSMKLLGCLFARDIIEEWEQSGYTYIFSFPDSFDSLPKKIRERLIHWINDGMIEGLYAWVPEERLKDDFYKLFYSREFSKLTSRLYHDLSR